MKKKISMVLLASVIASNVAPAINVFAEEVLKEQAEVIVEKAVSESKITNFNLKSFSAFEQYNLKYKVQREDILSISNNGGQYASSSIDKAIDGNTSTHWETGKANSSSFTNEVIFEFKNVESLDRIAYATRQDSAKGKGYPTKFEIYASVTGSDDDFQLVSTGSSSATGNMMEFKFDTIDAKKIKFVFAEANQSWASASEFWFYREDNIINKLGSIFTDDKKNKVSDEYNTVEKLETFENEAKNHPLYENYKEDFTDAKLILEGNNVVYKEAVVSKFKSFTDAVLVKYNELFKINIKSISTNGSHYGSSNIEKAIDGDINTSWHSGKQNSSSHTNEVILTLDKLETLDRVVYTSLVNRGFAKSFDIYVSRTATGDTFEKVTSGSSSITNNSLEIKFNPTEARRVKFVYKEGHENWALASEFALYKVDEVRNKMAELFTDSTMGEVSAEFNTAEKIDELENEAKNHPFYEDYKEDLSNARALINENKAEATKAAVSKFTPFYTAYDNAYSETFRMPNSNIAKISNNGGNYSSTNLNYAIDDNVNTHWETGKANSSGFENEILFELNEATVLNRIVYKARSNNKGFPEQFEIYGSATTKGDNFRLISTGSSAVTNDMTEFKFESTKFKRIKFVYKKANQDWASAGEFRFYSEDKLSEKIDNIFTNGLCTELSEEYNSIEAIEALEKEVRNHPLAKLYLSNIELAKELLENPDKLENAEVITLEQRGDNGKEAQEHGIPRSSYTLYTYGKYISPGETIKIYVDADKDGVIPQLVLGEVGESGKWDQFIQLKPGLNEITAPSIDEKKPAAIYFYNGALPTDQKYAPQIRVIGGTEYPVYRHGETDPAEFLKELEEYNKKVSINLDDFANGVNKDVVYNMAELTSKNNSISTSAKGALKGLQELAKENKTVYDTMECWETMWNAYQDFSGFSSDAEDSRNQIYDQKFTTRVFSGGSYGWSGHGYVGLNGGDNDKNPNRDGGFFKEIVKPITSASSDMWAYMHEWGHSMNNNATEHLEVTNNLYSGYISKVLGKKMDWCAWDNMLTRFSGNTISLGFWENLGILTQPLIYFGDSLYGEASAIGRTNPDGVLTGLSNNQQRIAVAYSVASGYNLVEFFNDWNYVKATDLMREKVSHLPKPDFKLEYLHGGAEDYKGTGFDENIQVEVSSKINEEDATNTLTFSIDNENKSDLLGYEILKDDQVIGFTRGTSFVVKNVDINENATYEVVPYAKNLTTSESISIKAFTPSMSLQQDNIMVKLNSEFNPLDLVKALNYKGEDISSKLEVDSNVDTSKKGTYKVKYTLVDNEVEIERTINVQVVSTYDYLSDTAWVSAETQNGTPRRNSNIKGRINGDITTFEKGFGIHATGKIVYDLGEHNYDTFEALVGVDMSIAANNNSSITFKVVGDGKTLATTKVLKHADDMLSLSVPVTGVKELVIEVNNGGNGNTSDHAVIANPKLSNNNMKPSIKISGVEDIVKLGSDFDLMEGISASDVEDGNLTNSIVVNDNGFNANKAGRYTIEYTVVDSDNNSKTLTREVVVYSNSVYASDIDWKSATTDWQSVRKDKASSGGTIKVGINGETKDFNKGIGTHANSTVIYDIEGKGYEYFETLVGIDRNISQQNNSSVIFQIFADGEKVFDSGLMKWSDDAKLARVNLKGVSELKLVANNGGNGNTSDHANFADAKFLITNSKPKLTIPTSISTKIGEVADLDGKYSATDAEDGDLTSEVKVEGKVNFNKSGKYEITYSVTDSDGNTVKAIREVKVVDMEHSEFLSDMDWKSAVNSYTSARKNQSINGNGLRLTAEDGTIMSYNKGIGAHSTSTLTYDLTKGDYGYFTSFVGVDRNVYGSVGSVSFEVYLDNTKVYDSGVMTSKQVQKFVEVNLAGAKELKLVVTDGQNGNGSDHAIWADAKLHLAKEGTVIETENQKSLRELIEYADTLTEDMVGEQRFKETVWYNFNCAKDEAIKALADSDKTENELYRAEYFLNYTIEDLKLIK